MADIDIRETLKELTGAALAVNEINEKLPEVREMLAENERIREDVRSLSAKAEDALKEAESLEEKARSEAEELIEKISEAASRNEKAVKMFSDMLDNAPDFSEVFGTVKKLAEYLASVEKKFDDKIAELEHAQKSRSAAPTYVKKSMDEYDKNRLYSIKEILEFEQPGRLIIERSDWFNDYCFIVERVDNNMAYGACYKNGFLDKYMGYPLTKDRFKIYEGPSREIILNGFQ